jgi:ribosomal protein S18 acetylase RimI-like enzyme
VAEGRSPIEVKRVPAGSLTEESISQSASVLQTLVRAGAALGWVDPPTRHEVAALLRLVVDESSRQDACLVIATDEQKVVGLGYWRRYARPTHQPHVDIEKIGVAPELHGQRIGRHIMMELIASARDARVEVITLDVRGDNEKAAILYESLGFVRYGVLPRFVAVGADRFDKLFYALDLRVTDRYQRRSAEADRSGSM